MMSRGMMSRVVTGRRSRVAMVGLSLAAATIALPASAQPRRFTQTSVCSDAQRNNGCLIVLGSGMPVPDPERAGPAYAVVYGDRTFLFDAGAGVMRRAAAAGLPIDGFTAVFLTHLHSDHTIGLPDVLLTTWVMGRRRSMPVFGPPGTRNMVDHLMAAWSEDIEVRTNGLERGQPGGQKADPRESTGGVMYDSAGVRITAVKVPHGEWKTAFAYVIRTPSRTFVLSGDTAPSDALVTAAAGADVLVHESYPAVRLKPEDRPGGESWPAYMHSVHTSDEEVGALARRASVKTLVLSHVIRMGGTDEELLAGVKKSGYMGHVHIARDLQAF